MTARAALLEVEALHTYYGESHILRGIDLKIGTGETVGLMGRNGMGKTTLIRTVMGLVRARSGRVRFGGADVTREAPYRIARAGIAYVPEGRGIFASLRVEENLAIAVHPARSQRAPWSIERVLEMFPRLKQRRGNRGDQLSGGEQQMLAIGRALLTNPELLILDEATEGLAPIIRDEIWRTIGEVRASGIATLIVDKDVAAVTRTADRIAILAKGAVVFEGEPQRLLTEPAVMHRHLGV